MVGILEESVRHKDFQERSSHLKNTQETEMQSYELKVRLRRKILRDIKKIRT